MELLLNKELFNIEKTNNSFKINGEETEIRLLSTLDDEAIIQSSKGKFRTFVASDEKKTYVAIDGRVIEFEKPADDDDKDYEAAAEDSNRQEVMPPMPGSIVQIEVEEGQKVKEGDVLVIVEAMKMETSLFASISGIVREINGKAGQQIDSDHIILVVEKEE